MISLKKYWDRLTQYERMLFLKQRHFWGGIRDFKYKLIPEDLKNELKAEMAKKQQKTRS